MTKRNMKFFYEAIMLCGLLLLLLPCSAVFADETAEVHIPVKAIGADCTAVLTDGNGTIIMQLALKDGVRSEFIVRCTGLLRFSYNIRLLDEDDQNYEYDHTIYTVYVDLFLDENGQVFYTITVDKLGVLGPDEGKQDAILFINRLKHTPTPTPTATATPTATPTPTPTATPTPCTPVTPEPPFPPLVPILPETGFSASNPRPKGPIDPDLYYRNTGWTLQIPALSLATDIMTVPMGKTNYDVSHLEDRVGLLEGYALPGDGYTIITGHDHLSETESGPFVLLLDMEIGDRIFILDPNDEVRIFEVYANEKIAEDDTAGLGRIMSGSTRSVTFITCEDERPEGGYANRRIVAARPVEAKYGK